MAAEHDPAEYDEIPDIGNEQSESSLESDRLMDSNHLIGSHEDEDVPEDRFHAVYFIFFIFGMCSVLPWNMFITANQYFSSKLGNDSASDHASPHDNQTSLQIMFESYFSMAAMIPNILMQVLNLALQHRISLQLRIIMPLSGMFALFILTTVLTKVDTHEWQITFFIISIISIMFISVCGAVFQGSVFGMASILPNRYMQACMSGQGMGGILPSLINIISISATNSPNESGFIYFLCAVVCIVITIVAFLALPRMRYAAHFLNKHANFNKVKRIQPLAVTESFEVVIHMRPPFFQIFKELKLYTFLITVIFAVSLALFPGTISQIRSFGDKHSVWSHYYFNPVMCFLVFNTMDFIGRTLSAVQWPTSKQMPAITVLVLLRLVFFPLFAFCNVPSNKLPPHVFFTNDAYPFVFNAVFAFTNGYLGTLIMLYAPNVVDIRHRETAGVMLSLFLSAGLAIGAIISVLYLNIF